MGGLSSGTERTGLKFETVGLGLTPMRRDPRVNRAGFFNPESVLWYAVGLQG